MGSSDAAGPTARQEPLRALHRKLQEASAGSLRPAEVMVGAGHLLRRSRAAGLQESEIESILGTVSREALEAWLHKDPAVALEAALERALEEGGEAGLADDAQEQEVWASSAHEALMARDRAESARVAVDRWERLKGKELKGAGDLRDRLEALDAQFRPRERLLVGLNRRRREERDLLDEGPREAAWWFARRSDCDDLLKLLAGTPSPSGQRHLVVCSDCREDLRRSRLVDDPPERHFTTDDLWKMDMGLAPEGDRRAFGKHAETCLPCAELFYAMEHGERAIEDVEREDEVPKPRPATPESGRPQRARRKVALERREFRLVVTRDRGHVRLLVEPRSAPGFAAAKVVLPPQRKVLSPKATSDGLEFDLGKEEELLGRTARITLKLTEWGDPIQHEVVL